jgi:acetyltransferase-like isoleucine patch superfamily enzyme
LGYKAHLGAGAILSNVRLDHAPVSVHAPGGAIGTGLRKFGAIVGDRAEIGCNSVLSPGSVIGRDSIIYPGTSWRGVLPPSSIAKTEPQTLRVIPRQNRD